MSHQRKDHVERIVVLVLDDGIMYGWEVFDGVAEWSMTGLNGAGRTQARLTVTGTFHRRQEEAPKWMTEEPELLPELVRPRPELREDHDDR